MKKMLMLVIASLGLGVFAHADNSSITDYSDTGNFKIMLNSCDSTWWRHGDDCIDYTGQCPEMYSRGQANCSANEFPGGGGYYDDEYGDDYRDGEGEGFGRIMSVKDVNDVATDLQPQHWGRRGFGSRAGGRCYQVCEYIYKGGA